MELNKDPRTMTREEIIKGFHQLYLANIEKETRRRGRLVGKGGGIPMERVKEIYNNTIGDYFEEIIRAMIPA